MTGALNSSGNRRGMHPPGIGNHIGARWRGRLKVPANCHPATRRLYAEANRQMTTLTEIADRAGLNRRTISQWGKDWEPNVGNLEAALNVLGLTLTVKPLEE